MQQACPKIVLIWLESVFCCCELVCFGGPTPKVYKNHMWRRQSLPSFACKCSWFLAFILKAIKWKAIILWTLLYFQYEMVVVVHMKGSPWPPVLTTYRWCFSKEERRWHDPYKGGGVSIGFTNYMFLCNISVHLLSM